MAATLVDFQGDVYYVRMYLRTLYNNYTSRVCSSYLIARFCFDIKHRKMLGPGH